MKVYIQTDIEGVAGFCFFENRADKSVENFHHCERMRRLLTGEVDAAVRGAFAAGADEVFVNDSHGTGYNILFEDLDPRCRIIHGRNCSGPHWLPLLDSSFGALVLIGMHAMAGTKGAITPHSLWKIGDLRMSEGAMAAAIAGDFGVPTVFASGDDKILAELTAKIPSLQTVETKLGLSPYQACSLIPARACERIRSGVEQAVAGAGAVRPWRIPGPVLLELFDSPDHVPPFRKLGETSAPTVNEAFLAAEDAMPWTSFHLEAPDGFVYP